MNNRIEVWIKENTPYKLISNEHIKTWRDKFSIIDDTGYKYMTQFSNITYGKKPQKFGVSNKHTIHNIEIYLRLNHPGYKILSTEYISANGDLNFICPLGHHFTKSWRLWQQVPRCNICSPAPGRTHHEFVSEVKNLHGDEYTVIGKYENSKTKIKMRHNACGNEWYADIYNFLNGTGCNRDSCFRKYGTDNHRYNPSLTEEERLSKRDVSDVIKWRNSIFEKYNYTCVICNRDTGDNVAHHLDGYNWDIENRFEIENGVCLCGEHHKEFHGLYGYGDNTKEQFDEYCNKIILSRANES